MVTADHGPAVSGAHNTIVCARAGKDLVSSLTSGLLTIVSIAKRWMKLVHYTICSQGSYFSTYSSQHMPVLKKMLLDWTSLQFQHSSDASGAVLTKLITKNFIFIRESYIIHNTYFWKYWVSVGYFM